MKFDLHVRAGRPEISEFAGRLASLIESHGGSVVESSDVTPDMVLAVGGDGTMLGAVYRAVNWDVPVLGFNLGTLGFLTEAEPEDVERVVGRLFSGDYAVNDRLTVSATAAGKTVGGVNDVVVEKIDSTRLVNLEVVIDGSAFATYRADGLIIATPTGSTAYSFSAGGPIVEPGSRTLIVTPIAGYLSAIRSVVAGPTQVVRCRVVDAHEALVSIDGREDIPLAVGDLVTVTALERPIRLVEPRGTIPFWDLLRRKVELLPS